MVVPVAFADADEGGNISYKSRAFPRRHLYAICDPDRQPLRATRQLFAGDPRRVRKGSLMLASLAGGLFAGDASGGASDRVAERKPEGRRHNHQLSGFIVRDAAADLRGADDHYSRDLVSHRMGRRGGDDSGFVPLAAGSSFAYSGRRVRLRIPAV